MSAAQPVADGRVIPLPTQRMRRPGLSRRMIKAAAVFAFCLLGLIGSFADSAVARTGLLLIGPTGDPGSLDLSGLDNVTATLIWATVANLAACAGVVMVTYWLITRPTAQVVALRARRYKD